jgi:hypothetical protein
MKFFLLMTALVGGQAQDYKIPMSPIYVHDVQTCEAVAREIVGDYEATQANFQVLRYQCVGG